MSEFDGICWTGSGGNRRAEAENESPSNELASGVRRGLNRGPYKHNHAAYLHPVIKQFSFHVQFHGGYQIVR